MAKQKIILITVILVLLIGNVFFAAKYFNTRKELSQTQTALEIQTANEKVLEFTKLFIEKVLKADSEVDFETRLKLENAVRELKDKEILDQWNKFVNSQIEIDAQNELEKLLEVLVDKIKTQ